MVQANERMQTPVEAAAPSVASRLGNTIELERRRHVPTLSRRQIAARVICLTASEYLTRAILPMLGFACRGGMGAAAHASSTLA